MSIGAAGAGVSGSAVTAVRGVLPDVLRGLLTGVLMCDVPITRISGRVTLLSCARTSQAVISKATLAGSVRTTCSAAVALLRYIMQPPVRILLRVASYALCAATIMR